MGLDMYIVKKKNEICPHCGMALKAKRIEFEDELCYWRKEWDLFHFISNEIAPDGYGDEQYGSDLELSIDDLKKIIKFEKERAKSGGFQIQIAELYEGIEWLKEDENNHICYNADW